MAKLLRFILFSIAFLSVAKQGSAQQFVHILYVTPTTGDGAKNGISWGKAVNSIRFQIAINGAAISIVANPDFGGMGWSKITSSS